MQQSFNMDQQNYAIQNMKDTQISVSVVAAYTVLGLPPRAGCGFTRAAWFGV